MKLSLESLALFQRLELREDECAALVVQARALAALGRDDDAEACLAGASNLADRLGRDSDYVERLLRDTGSYAR